jgi:hypothetical protein
MTMQGGRVGGGRWGRAFVHTVGSGWQALIDTAYRDVHTSTGRAHGGPVHPPALEDDLGGSKCQGRMSPPPHHTASAVNSAVCDFALAVADTGPSERLESCMRHSTSTQAFNQHPEGQAPSRAGSPETAAPRYCHSSAQLLITRLHHQYV